MQQTDCNRLNVLLRKCLRIVLDVAFVERRNNSARCIHPLGDFEYAMARHQRRRYLQLQVVEVETAFTTHFEKVAKVARNNERGTRSAAFDQCIGGERGAVEHASDPLGVDAAVGYEPCDSVYDACSQILVVGENLADMDAACCEMQQCEIGECAADVDAEVPAVTFLHWAAHQLVPLACQAGCRSRAPQLPASHSPLGCSTDLQPFCFVAAGICRRILASRAACDRPGAR